MTDSELLPHLFRTEYRKIVAVLTGLFGIENIAIAEDVASETFLMASETWGLKGLPPNPAAWLYRVAKNKAIDQLRRNKLFNDKISKTLLRSGSPDEPEVDLSAQNISDSQLQMMFAVCHPSIPREAQIGLALNILCGFGVDEIADAFLSNRETIYKRLARAKEKLRTEKIKMELPVPEEINKRLETVLTTLYLLFNEGYYSSSQNTKLRKDLCMEAMRLTLMLTENPLTNIPEANALLSLMCFHASRFEARINANGEIVLYEDQDDTLWDKELIEKGKLYLETAFANGNKVGRFHMEAAIALWHTNKTDSPEKWETILQFYNRLLQIEYSPVAALNRTYALAKANGKQQAIIEAEKLKLDDNHLYHSLLAELYSNINNDRSLQHLQRALSLAKSESDKLFISKKIEKLTL
jgi:RNA polymerase sigma-70 factor (ECF subfamily)